MKISTKSEYGLRAMIDLALSFEKNPVLLKDISKKQDISFKYLGQLFLLLKNSGLIKGQRGSKGGYSLNRNPAHITLLEIFEALEGPLSLTECDSNDSCCSKTFSCVTHDIWKQTKNMIHDFFKDITLEKLAIMHKEKMKSSCKNNFHEIYKSEDSYETNIFR
jgi:Rrf2 family protein